MIKIIDNCDTGKTRRLMEIAKENNAIFVCNNPARMSSKAQSYGIIGLTFINYEEFLKDSTIKNYVIDELDNILDYIHLTGNCMGYSLTKG